MFDSVHRVVVRGSVVAAAMALALSSVGAAQDEDKLLVGLVVKDLQNPFFEKMIEGAQAKGEELGIEILPLSGENSADNQGQVDAIDNLISAGAKGLLLTASDSAGIVPAVERAKEAGMLVIALDTQLDPPDAAHMTFATDNRLAGNLIGQWALGTLGDAAADAKLAAINDSNLQTSVDVQRNQGMFDGFGIEVNDENLMGDEDDPRVVGQDVSAGSREGGRTAMENLLAASPDINVLHTINEPTAEGAYEALKQLGLEEQVTIVSVDGSCVGVQNVADGVIGATAMQFPLLMASIGVESVAQFAADGTLPEPTEGKEFYDTGVALITDASVADLESYDSVWGLENCWGKLPGE